MQLNLVADRVVKGRIYPALAQWGARPYTPAWREFGSHFPHTVPVRLQEYCDHHAVKINIFSIADQLPAKTFYPIGLGFFDFDIDYFALLPGPVTDRLRQSALKVLFYYHEGDNPLRIKQRLDALLIQHQLPLNSYVFVSANTAARDIPGFVYFTDFELWYWQRNHNNPALPVHQLPRERDFTALVRLHKPWRAMCMADLHRQNILTNSYWSYCETVDPADMDPNDSPIQVDAVRKLRTETAKFLAYTPYVSDELDNHQRNNHSVLEPKYHVNSYCNIVLETHFDADQSGGTFLTEKTFKPIKHGQMFFIVGPAGSLELLRKLGYRTFDSVLDNSYDTIVDNTQRWLALRGAVAAAKPRLLELFAQAHDDIVHNQQLFCKVKTQRLNSVVREINDSY
jgi:hypothetical protein